MKGLMKGSHGGSAMWRGWRGIGIPRESMLESSRSVGSSQKRWIDIMKECLKKRGLNVRQTRRIVQDSSEWQGFVRGNTWGTARGMNP